MTDGMTEYIIQKYFLTLICPFLYFPQLNHFWLRFKVYCRHLTVDMCDNTAAQLAKS